MGDELSMRELVHRAIDSVAAMLGSMVVNGQLERADLLIFVKHSPLRCAAGTEWSFEERSFGDRAEWQSNYRLKATSSMMGVPNPDKSGYAVMEEDYIVAVSCSEPKYEKMIAENIATLIKVPLERQRARRILALGARAFS